MKSNQASRLFKKIKLKNLGKSTTAKRDLQRIPTVKSRKKRTPQEEGLGTMDLTRAGKRYLTGGGRKHRS